MALDWIIVDGYNLIYKDEGLTQLMGRDIGLARQRLTRILESAVPRLADRITVVFDGRGQKSGRSDFESTSVEVSFSAGNSSADTLIESIVAEAKDPGRIMVVTSDNLVTNAVAGSGAETASCPAFLDRLYSLGRAPASGVKRAVSASKFGRIGDIFGSS